MWLVLSIQVSSFLALIVVDLLKSCTYYRLAMKNLLLPAPDKESPSRFEDKHIASPLPRKVLDDRVIYTSPFVFPPSDVLLLLCDFGEARRLPPEGSGQVLNEDIMRNPYRAPIPDITLESMTESRVNGTEEDKREFVRWLRMALQWEPEDRPSALGLLYDEWMLKSLKLRGRASQS